MQNLKFIKYRINCFFFFFLFPFLCIAQEDFDGDTNDVTPAPIDNYLYWGIALGIFCGYYFFNKNYKNKNSKSI